MDNLKKNIKNIINQNKSTENNTESDTEEMRSGYRFTLSQNGQSGSTILTLTMLSGLKQSILRVCRVILIT